MIVTTRSFGTGSADPAALLESVGLEVVRSDPGHDLKALREPLARAVAWIAGTGPITKEHLAAAPGLRIIARYGVGVDSVDLRAAEERKIVVTNTPGANSEAVADHTITLILAALRHLLHADRSARRGEYPALRGRELGALTVGIVGFGRVGRAVSRRLAGGFGSRVLVYDPYVSPSEVERVGAEPVYDLMVLAQLVDVLTLHVPGSGKAVVDVELLCRIRQGAVLINTARGDLVDEEAVASALEEGRLSAAAVDVLASEPALESPLLRAPNTIVTPHIAAQTNEAIDRMGMEAAREVVRVVSGEAPLHPVIGPFQEV
ncbi:phosphoglycerate dehydrogenase [Rubrobacter xylanophilus]|uniref:phosphoglycerate dehydrogenase n=1 Tax=Rubrobacter xylanophilus TaxID=49319 RepID=UPI001C63DC03|nr:phosphoglycerate dehydrogenase [Rubrobacter xylanophilus]